MRSKHKFVDAALLQGQGRRRITVWLVLAVLVVTLGGCQFGRQREPEPTLLPTPTINVGTSYTVQRGPVAHVLRFNGRAALGVTEDLFFNTNGRVQAIYVKSGDMVAADQIIAQLDTRDLQFKVDDAKLALALARQRLADAEKKLGYDQQIAEIALAVASRRLAELADQEEADPTEWYIQQLEVERAALLVEQLKLGVDPQLLSAVERAELVLAQAQAALADAQIIAPFDGQVQLFEELVEGRGVEAYTPVATVVDPQSIQVKATLLDADLAQLREGMTVTIQPSSRPNVSLAGVIAVLPQPYGNGPGTELHITVDDEQAANLRAGMTATVEVELDRVEDALWVPPAALHGVPNRYYVRVRDGDTVRDVDVVVGVRNEERVEITQGVEEGQVLVGS